MKQAILILSCLLLLNACSIKQEVTHYYQLGEQRIFASKQAPEMALKITLSTTLNQQSLVYQNTASQLHFAQYHRWANPLSESIENVLSSELNRLGTNKMIPAHLNDKNLPVIMVYIDRFQGTYLGETEISGFARFPNGQQRNFTLHTPQQGDGYVAMVRSLEVGLNQLAAFIQLNN